MAKDKDINYLIGQRVKERRKSLNMTQSDLAFKMGYKTKSTIARIEAGDYDLQRTKIYQLATVLHTSTDWLLGQDDTDVPKVPIYNGVKYGVGINVDNNRELPLVVPVSFLSQEAGKFIAVTYDGASMPDVNISDGDILIFHATEKDFTDGDIVLAKVYKNQLVKRALHTNNGILLMTTFTGYPLIVTSEDFELIGILNAILKKV